MTDTRLRGRVETANTVIDCGLWRPGQSLGAIFRVYAAPQDLAHPSGKPNMGFTLPEAVEKIAGLHGWQGYDGENIADEAALYEALRSGRYNGGWIVPPQPVLDSNLLPARDTMPEGSEFITDPERGHLRSYWSLRRHEHWDGNQSFPGFAWQTSFADRPPPAVRDGVDLRKHWQVADLFHFSVRPVRLERVEHGALSLS